MPVPRKQPKPPWLKAAIPTGEQYFRIKKALEKRKLSTICQSAKCPNISECWNNKHATFLIMGDACSRNCSFCSVKHADPGPLDPQEPQRVLEMTEILQARYVVITSVTRDDLDDGGSSHFAQVIRTLKENKPQVKIEVLIPDFQGNRLHLDTVLDAEPDVLNHNLETIHRLYPHVNRPPENYHRALQVIKNSKKRGFVTKSGIMVGLGETMGELEQTFQDLRNHGCDLLTIGQYLQPTRQNVPVEKFYTPEEFTQLKDLALSHGFKDTEAGPFVRSSYQADRMFRNCGDTEGKAN